MFLPVTLQININVGVNESLNLGSGVEGSVGSVQAYQMCVRAVNVESGEARNAAHSGTSEKAGANNTQRVRPLLRPDAGGGYFGLLMLWFARA